VVVEEDKPGRFLQFIEQFVLKRRHFTSIYFYAENMVENLFKTINLIKKYINLI